MEIHLTLTLHLDQDEIFGKYEALKEEGSVESYRGTGDDEDEDGGPKAGRSAGSKRNRKADIVTK